MRKFVTTFAALTGAAIVTASGAYAAGVGSPAKFAASPSSRQPVIQVHSSQEVHDILHGQGYEHVVYQSQYGGGDGKPNYRFRACQGRRAFLIDVDWYGEVISRERDGRCHEDGYDRNDY